MFPYEIKLERKDIMAIVKGTDALKPAEKKGSEDRVLRYIKAGESIKVRLLGAQEFARVPVYDIYPLTGTVGIPQGVNHFEAGMKILFTHADDIKANLDVDKKREEMTDVQFKDFKEKEGKVWVDALQEAYRLDEESRFLFAFVDAETGQTFVMQASENAGAAIQQTIESYQAQKDMMLYTITKAKGGFQVLPDMSTFNALTPEQTKIIEDTKDLDVPVELFAEAHFQPNEAFQLDVLAKMNEGGVAKGLLTEYVEAEKAKLEASKPADNAPKDTNVGEPLDIEEEDLPF
ncbi:hypothetical protein [Bacillus cereus]|uniref:hypothetical protein n=1 Tax=Bacillus cereus TaxID=1396 RepID=UPI0011A9E266|nr:hypothetical protein [Bacillus cereus]